MIMNVANCQAKVLWYFLRKHSIDLWNKGLKKMVPIVGMETGVNIRGYYDVNQCFALAQLRVLTKILIHHHNFSQLR